MDDTFAYYEEESLRLGFFEHRDSLPSNFFRETQFKLNQEKGSGWLKMVQIDNGLYVGLCDYQLNQRLESVQYKLIFPVQFNIMLSGYFELQLPGEPAQLVGPGDIWFGHNHEEQIMCSQHHENNICGLSIGLPSSLLETWLGDYDGETNKGLERLISGKSCPITSKATHLFPLARSLHSSTELMRSTRELLMTEHRTIFGKLHFESLVLGILAQLLTLGNEHERSVGQGENRLAVDTAADILRSEWISPPTISSLAKRVGTNECYLKKGFRHQIGMSIGQYIRELRMSKALELLETGKHSVMDIALAVGYTNPSHFSAAFKKFYGKVPSRYLSEISQNNEKKRKFLLRDCL